MEDQCALCGQIKKVQSWSLHMEDDRPLGGKVKCHRHSTIDMDLCDECAVILAGAARRIEARLIETLSKNFENI